jgi:hypothetical protein
MTELERLKQLCDNATPGPWDNRCTNGIDNMAKPRHIWTEYGFICELKSPLNSSVSDAEFIAESRTALPRAIRALELAYSRIKYEYLLNLDLMENASAEGKFYYQGLAERFGKDMDQITKILEGKDD